MPARLGPRIGVRAVAWLVVQNGLLQSSLIISNDETWEECRTYANELALASRLIITNNLLP